MRVQPGGRFVFWRGTQYLTLQEDRNLPYVRTAAVYPDRTGVVPCSIRQAGPDSSAGPVRVHLGRGWGGTGAAEDGGNWEDS